MPAAHSLSYRHHFKATLLLGLPLIGTQLTQMLGNITDTVMLGWLGTKELAAGTLAFQSAFIVLIFALGFGAAMLPLIAKALGQGDKKAVRRTARMGLWALFGLSLLFMLPLWFTADILKALQQEAELADLAQEYMRIAQWSLIPAFVLIGLRSFLTALEKTMVVLLSSIATAVFNGLLNYMLIFGNWGAPRLEMAGAAYATVLANILVTLFTILYIARAKHTKSYALFVRLSRPDWSELQKIIELGAPISLFILAEAGMFSAATIMVGWLGVVPLAAHSIALQCASLAFMVPLGLSQAASVRIGNAVGREDKVAIGRAGYSIIILSLIVAVFCAFIFVTFSDELAFFFLSDDNPDLAQIIQISTHLLYVAAGFQIVDALQVGFTGNLRGLQDTTIPMVIGVVSYWCFGMIMSYGLAFYGGYGATGIWLGLAFGLAVASIGLSIRFIRRDHYKLVFFSQ